MKSDTSPKHLAYRPDIDGLRAIAVILVLLFHAFPQAFPMGYLGVDIFFVISGYLITGNILTDLGNQNFSLALFYAKRCRRILPALFTMMSAVFVAAFFLLPSAPFWRLGRHLVGGALFVSNILLARESGYFDSSSDLKMFLHLWSLSIEEQFYLVWPLLVLLRWRWPGWGNWLLPMVFAASVGAGVHWSQTNTVWAFYSIFSRFWELALGCALAYAAAAAGSRSVPSAIARAKAHSCWAALALLVASQLFFRGETRIPGFGTLSATIGAVLFLVSGERSFFNAKVLSASAMRAIGRISYPLYLWHWPLLVFVRYRWGLKPPLAYTWAALAASFILATLTWRWVEQPIQRRLRFGPLGTRKNIFWALGLSGAFGAFLTGTGLLVYKEVLPSLDRLRNPVSYLLARYEVYDITATRHGSCFIDTNVAFSGFATDCYSVAGPSSGILLGDSVAAHLYPGLRKLFEEKKVPLAQLNATGCPPLEGMFEGSCGEANTFAMKRVKELHPRIVLLFANWQRLREDKKLMPGLVQTIRGLRASGTQRVIVVGPNPLYKDRVHQILDDHFARKKLMIPDRLSIGLEPSVFSVNRDLAQAAREAGAEFIDILGFVCDDNGCLTQVGPDLGNDLLIYDTDHLSRPGADYITEKLLRSALFP